MTYISRTHLVAAVAAAAFIIVGGCDKPKAPAAPPAPPEVVVITPQQRDVPILREWLGTADGSVNADVRSRVQGYVQSREYREGSTVKTGDLLYQIDPRPFEAALEQAKADLSRAQANLGRTQLDVDRLTPLAPSGAISQQELDNAVQDNKANAAAVEAAKAAVEQAALNLQYTRITAPIDGVAGISKAAVGDLVGPSGAQMTTVSTLDPVRIYFPISEQEYIRLAEKISRFDPMNLDPKEGSSSLELILADGSVYSHRGTAEIINRQVDQTTGTIRIAARFPNPGNIIRPGQYAMIRAVVDVRKGALLVPQRCVGEVQGTQMIAVVGADNKVAIRTVTTGERIGSDWVVETGLKPGERVVMEGIQKVRDGTVVAPTAYDPNAKAKPESAPSESSAKPAKGN